MTQQTAHMKHRRTNKEQLQQKNHIETKIDVRVHENKPAQSHVPRPEELQLFKSVIRSGQKYVWWCIQGFWSPRVQSIDDSSVLSGVRCSH